MTEQTPEQTVTEAPVVEVPQQAQPQQEFNAAEEIIEDLAQKNAALTKENSFLRVALKQRDMAMQQQAQEVPAPTNRAARRKKTA